MDFKHINDTTPATVQFDKSWRGYPQNLFGNWTPDRVKQSQMFIKCSENQSSTVYLMDVLKNGQFIKSDLGYSKPNDPCTVSLENEEEFWEKMERGVRLVLCMPDWV